MHLFSQIITTHVQLGTQIVPNDPREKSKNYAK